jgi:uncharacterized Zn-binding protein involved in type VI secretion|tara:strand:+ start:481 stop:801 length:321 start_codon:yes stop_codon:yes gene_type:complete
MPRISRNKDKCATGHLCTKKVSVNASQYSVFVNGRPALRRGDKCKRHTMNFPPPPGSKKKFICLIHNAKVKQGSRRVFVGGIPVARKGDRADKGAMVGASRNVFAG